MTSRWTPIKSALALALCSASLAFAAEAPVQAGDDFFTYANGDWLARTEIPADRSSWGAFASIAEGTNARLRTLIEQLVADPDAKGEARQVADFYQAFMDEAAIEAKGSAPLKPLLARIAAIKDKAGLTRVLGASIRADVDPLNSSTFDTENLFGLWVAQGLQDPLHNTPYLLQGGLGMPDRAYYLDDTPRMAELRSKYRQHIGAMLALAGFDDVDKRAGRVLELETAIARSHAPREDSGDVQKSNNPWRASDFASRAPGMDWKAFFKAAQLQGAPNFIVWHPSALTGAAKLVASADLAAWKDFLAFHQINQHAASLPKAFGEQHFAFHAKTLAGTLQQPLRWKRALAEVNDNLDEALGHLYVARHFPASDKLRLQQMVANITAAFSRRIDQLDWMTPATRAQAQAKLKSLYVGVGYPDRWRSFAGLTVSPTDALGNTLRAEAFNYAQQVARLHQKVDRTAWAISPQVVNAINLPLQNALNFPAAILQPPFFDAAASDAANYGAIGAVIGHEISHSFDDQGAQFDAQGRLRDWWTADDTAHFKQSADKLVAQFSAYQPFPDLAVNGQLTLSENLADLGGVAASYDAYRATLAGKVVPADADQQFFLGYAHAWQTKIREATLRQRILTDGHAPARYRTAIVRNLDAWYAAFNVQPGQALFLAPAQRVRVW
ncbi:MAG: M13 family metallopeptidase [Pseudomonadota bacterium]